ncbi:hypothetical protein [Methanothrix sp.]|uniref:hypothetical protein n=1 Tax=Methanothrix sp. TaxID=90426 RepID=UPI003BB743AD
MEVFLGSTLATMPFPWKSVYLKKITAGLETNPGEAKVSFVLSALLKHNPTAVEENHMSSEVKAGIF